MSNNCLNLIQTILHRAINEWLLAKSKLSERGLIRGCVFLARLFRAEINNNKVNIPESQLEVLKYEFGLSVIDFD